METVGLQIYVHVILVGGPQTARNAIAHLVLRGLTKHMPLTSRTRLWNVQMQDFVIAIQEHANVSQGSLVQLVREVPVRKTVLGMVSVLQSVTCQYTKDQITTAPLWPPEMAEA